MQGTLSPSIPRAAASLKHQGGHIGVLRCPALAAAHLLPAAACLLPVWRGAGWSRDVQHIGARGIWALLLDCALIAAPSGGGAPASLSAPAVRIRRQGDREQPWWGAAPREGAATQGEAAPHCGAAPAAPGPMGPGTPSQTVGCPSWWVMVWSWAGSLDTASAGQRQPDVPLSASISCPPEELVQ